MLFVLVGIPAILWSAWGTNDELKALDSTEARQARCVEKISSLALSREDSQGMCRCMVMEADKRGVTEQGALDEGALKPVVELCYQVYVLQ